MPADPDEQGLSQSSDAALRWAWACAAFRAGDSSGAAPTVEVTSFDLLTGILLAHVEDSEPRQLFAHFGIPIGAVLAAAGVPRYDAPALLEAWRALPTGERVPLTDDARQALIHATGTLPDDIVVDVLPLRTLFGGLLATDNPASRAIRSQLASRGVDPDAVVASYHDYLKERRSYREFLAERHPYTPPNLAVPAYHADEPLTRRPAAPGGQADLVGIGAEVDGFAYLIASKALRPPLAIGLFGDWGSGKSFFLRSLQRRIDALIADRAAADRPDAELPFHRSIVQIEFNAWQYVEGDLWASLLEHLFRNLAAADDDDLLRTRQRDLIAQMTKTTAERDKALRKRKKLEQQQETAKAEVAQREAERELALAALEDERRRHPWTPSKELREQVRAATDRAGMAPVVADALELNAALAEAEDTLRGAGPMLAPLRGHGWRYTAGLVAVLLLAPAIAFGLERLANASAVSSAMGGLAWVLASAAAYVRMGSHYVRTGLGAIAEARQRLETERAQERRQATAPVVDARKRLDEVERQLAAAVDKERELGAQAADLDVTLARTTPSRVLDEFIADRLGSEDYRGRLGVPALVRRDLERLSQLLMRQNTDGAGAPDDEHAIDRIVLYIDDLDRCPTNLVVKVLQAVHLLLAFPLFVVVVAVDARWLVSSLREHYSGQLGGDGATPGDYLEKIFQIPFWVRQLPQEIRERMLRGLLGPSLDATEPTDPRPSAAQPAAPERMSDADRAAFDALVASLSQTETAAPPWLEAARLTITPEELRAIQAAAPLLASTPRSVKRFANVFLLLKAMGRTHAALPDGYDRVILLLAITSGLPHLAMPLFTAIDQAPATPLTLADALDALDALPTANPTQDPAPSAKRHADPLRSQRERLDAWLAQHPERKHLDLADLGPWLALIRRFSFT